MIVLLQAPIAFRIPISLVRSVTETSIMFMIPMPPTRREIAAMPPIISAIVLLTLSIVSMISD